MSDVAARVLHALRSRQPIALPVALVAAHPDDETIGAGASLRLFERLLLVHTTDGAPIDGLDARAAGHATTANYARARRSELSLALGRGGAGAELATLGFADQVASLNLGPGKRRLAELLARHGSVCVITHPYEGGHPDHDATAHMVHGAAAMLPKPPCILEMTSYHGSGPGLAAGVFLRNGEAPLSIALSVAECRAKQAMLDAFTSQQATLAAFGTTTESFRRAPRYDFTQPPHPGPLHYERYDWGMTGPRWRELAAAE